MNPIQILRRPARTSLLAVLAACLCAAPFATPLAQAQQRAPRVQLADAIVAVVNSEVVTRNELEERLARVRGTMRAQGIGLPPAAELERQVLESMIIERVQLQRAREASIRVDDGTIDRAVASIAERNGLNIEGLRARLESDGIAYAQFRDDLRKEIAIERLREREIDNRVQVADSEIENFLAADAKAAQSEQELNIAHIVIRIPENASAEEIAARRQRAEEVLARLQGGADFAQLAATYSDASDALTGGDLGWRTPDRLPQLYVGGLRGLQNGQASQLLRSANGFHILQLKGRRAAGNTDTLATASVQQTRARHILIKVNQIVSASEARHKLVELKQRIENGAAKFEDLARSHSNDLSASRGGDLGWIYPGDTVPQFERAMNALKPGEISEPIESPFGYHLIQVLERKQDDVSEERKRRIAQQVLRQRKAEEATQDWLRQLRDSAYVEYRLDELPSAS
ncbi:MAG TPA: peptidylprolyl isomerase [Noviherbaspirillum sp.]